MNIDGKEVRLKAVAETLVDWLSSAVVFGLVWSVLIQDGVPLKDQWFAIALAVTAGLAMAKFMRSFKLIDKG